MSDKKNSFSCGDGNISGSDDGDGLGACASGMCVQYFVK